MSDDSAFEGGDFFKYFHQNRTNIRGGGGGAINQGMAGNRGERVYEKRIQILNIIRNKSSVIIRHFLFSCATREKICGQYKYAFVFEINSYKCYALSVRSGIQCYFRILSNDINVKEL